LERSDQDPGQEKRNPAGENIANRVIIEHFFYFW
jgi:hypothetical protein